MTRHWTRREVVKGAAAGAVGMTLASATRRTWASLGANEKIVVGFIGTGGQGMSHLHHVAQMKDITIAAVCDVDQSRCEGAARAAGSSPRMFKDFRQLLEMKEIDAVFIAPPGHWHGVPMIHACRAGKDVYVEKPMCHNIREGRAMVEAARTTNRIITVGTQQRSTPHWINAVERIKAGEIGRVTMVQVWNAWNVQDGVFGRLGQAADCDPPAGVDYDMWLGPAPKRPFNPARFHLGHYYFWDYGGGMVSDWGIHLFDVVTWAMGPELKSVSTVGGKLVFDDARDTPDTVCAVFECPGYTVNYTLRHGNAWAPNGQMDHGIQFMGSKGTLQINRAGFQIYAEPGNTTHKPVYSEDGDTGILDHERNFFDCVRSRKRTNADAEVGHRGSMFGHLANISYRVGRRIRWDSANETIVDDAEASKLLTRQYRAPWTI